MRKSLLFSAAALATLATSAQVAEFEDITPAGYNFDLYENGQVFELQNPEGKLGGWSVGEGTFEAAGGVAKLDEIGHVTVLNHAGQGRNYTANMDNDRKGVYIHDFGGYLGKCLVLDEPWSVYAANGWGGTYTSGGGTQFVFYSDPRTTPTGWAGAAVRVRVVLAIHRRHRHTISGSSAPRFANIYVQDDGDNGSKWPYIDMDNAPSISCDEFWRWEGEGECVAEIPATQTPATGLDPLDSGSVETGYIINPDRFMVYEFDTYNPHQGTLKDQPLRLVLHGTPQNASIIIKEVKFLKITNPMDLLDEEGNPIPGASLLGSSALGSVRSKTWRYYTAKGLPEFTGVEELPTSSIEADGPAEYFNLQGVRVLNPENGLYIVRQGSKVSKQFIR